MRVVVAGAGPAGLLAAVCLHDDGHEVTLVDPDGYPRELADPDALAAAPRRGSPQAPHPHNFMPLARVLLRDLVPEVLEEVLSRGAQEVDMLAHLPNGPRDDHRERDLVALACRRPLLEQALLGAVLRRGVPVVRAEATAAMPDGLRTSAGPLDADLVVDAAGRRSPLQAAWAAQGQDLRRRRESCGITYVTRHYRLHQDEAPTALLFGLAARTELDFLLAALFRGDNSTFSVIVGTDPEDRDLRRALRPPDAYTAVLRQLPALAPWVSPETAEPVTDVMVMGGLESSVLEGPTRGEPYVAIGDAALTTNPRFGWGASLAFLHATFLRDAVREEPEAREAAQRASEAIAADAATRFRASCEEDRARLSWWRGGPWTPSPGARLGLASRGDRALAVAAARRIAALDAPYAHLDRPEVVAGIDAALPAILAAGPGEGPARRDLLAVAART